jgi:energy-converting hydrogenase A subunit R
MLDNLYFSSGLFDMVGVEVVGGQRKVRALLAFAKEAGLEVKDVVAVGDSITDFKMLGEVSKRGGLSIAFNANEYCLPYADVGVASADGRAVLPVIAEFLRSGREGAVKKVEELSRDLSGLERRFKYLKELEPEPHYCSPQKGGTEFEDLLKAHKKMRLKVRGEAGKLG